MKRPTLKRPTRRQAMLTGGALLLHIKNSVEIEDALSEKLLHGEYRAGQLIVADVEEEQITFRAVDSPPDTPPVELAGSGGGETEA